MPIGEYTPYYTTVIEVGLPALTLNHIVPNEVLVADPYGLEQSLCNQLLQECRVRIQEAVGKAVAEAAKNKGAKYMPVQIKKKSEFDKHMDDQAQKIANTIDDAALKFVLNSSPLKTKPAMGGVTITKKVKGTEVSESFKEEEVMKTGVIPPHKLAQVHVAGSTTINLGNFESARIEVGLTMPTDLDDIGDAYEFATDWVSDKITKATEQVKGSK